MPQTNHEVQIRLTNSGVPLSVIDNDANEIFPTDFTDQLTLPCVNRLNVLGIVNTQGESDEPLLKLTITRFTKLNSTSIGASSSHALCAFSLDLPVPLAVLKKMTSVDGTGFLLFFRHLSQLYQGLGPIDLPPYYEPEAIKSPEPPKAPSTWKQPWRNGMEFVAFRLTAAQLAEIHNSVTEGKGIAHSRITRMDIVTGLLARCLSEVEPGSKPIDTVMHVVNVRAFVLSCNSTHFF